MIRIDIMSDEEIAFDDWEKEAELIAINQQQEIKQSPTVICQEPIKDNPQQHHQDPYQGHLIQIERIKRMTEDEFKTEFRMKDQHVQEVKPFSALLKAEKEFIDLASSIADYFKATAKQSPEKILPESEMLTFFEQFLLYLYPNIEWESIETVKEKTKIVKKEKKEEQTKARKIRQKEIRLKRGFNKQESINKQEQLIKADQNEDEDEGM